ETPPHPIASAKPGNAVPSRRAGRACHAGRRTAVPPSFGGNTRQQIARSRPTETLGCWFEWMQLASGRRTVNFKVKYFSSGAVRSTAAPASSFREDCHARRTCQQRCGAKVVEGRPVPAFRRLPRLTGGETAVTAFRAWLETLADAGAL